MTDLTTASLQIATDFIAVRYRRTSASDLLARCNKWLADVEQEEWTIRNSGCRVERKLDLLDKARDRVRAVQINCEAVS